MTPGALGDEQDRARAGTDLDTTFAVEAGAGTGKTSLLVNRMLTILLSGRAGLDQTVAITFTEKAAGELKVRLREEIERRRANASEGDASRVERERLQHALEDLERAHVSTIHAFCAALLREYPLAAGVDPAFAVLDEIAATLLRHRVWDDWLAAEMDAGAPAVILALRSGMTVAQLRLAAFQWLAQRDLLGAIPPPLAADVAGFLDRLDARCERLAAERAHCRDERDTAAAAIAALAQWRAELRGLDEADASTVLLRGLRIRRKAGNRQNWRRPAALAAAREILRALYAELDELRTALGHNRACALVGWLGGFLARYEAAKRERGALDFTDLLLITRDLLRGDHEMRRVLQRRYRYVLVDEFQDTDPLQAEIVFLLAEATPRADDWRAVTLTPGKLFLVGDPKQSIYRFRRADLATYRAATAAVARQGEVAVLRTNFRSAAPLVDWFNRRFAPLLDQPDEGLRYVDLLVGPGAAPATDRDVIWLPVPPSVPSTASRAERRRLEAQTVVAFLRQITADAAWTCRGADGRPRPIRFGDVAILFRRYDAMRAYQDALREHDTPHRVLGGRRLLARPEVIEVLAVLKAVHNPNDAVAVVATLRGGFCAVADDELLIFRRRGGMFDPTLPVPPDAPAAIATAFEWISRLRARSREVTAHHFLREIYASSHYLALQYLKPQGEQLVANLLKLLDVARALERDGVDTLAGFVRVMDRLQGLEVEAEESPVSEAGDDVVRLLTIHKAKGLEFPVVVVADGAPERGPRPPSIIVDRTGGQLAFHVGGRALGLATRGWMAARDHEAARMAAEQRRLLYVAATRARDYLVLPRLREARRASSIAALAAVDDRTFTPRPGAGRRPSRAFRLDVAPLLAGAVVTGRAEAWEELARRRRGRLRSPVISVTALGDAAQAAPPKRLAAPPAGTTLGAVVHQALRRSGLQGPDVAVRIAETLARATGLEGEDRVAAAEMVRRAHDLPTVRRALAGVWYREMPFAVGWQDVVVEGVVDLAFIEAGELVVVDLKTDRIDGVSLAEKLARYRPQLVLYACGLQRATGLTVKEAWLSFLRDGSEECLRADWDGEAAALLAQVTA